MAATVADAAVGSASAGAGADDVGVPSGSGGGWVQGVDSVKEASDRLVSFVADVLARHGWTAIFLVIVWYNCKDAVKRRYRKWRKLAPFGVLGRTSRGYTARRPQMPLLFSLQSLPCCLPREGSSRPIPSSTTKSSKRSLDVANRPDRRAVLDRERARSVAEKQAQALEDARAAAERKTQQKMQSYARTTTSTKDD
ncbi:unnamed protein product [Ectocarpus sp. 12 AP-2014]